jgi:hypothetical protein
MTSPDHPGGATANYLRLSRKLSTLGRLLSANRCWPPGTGILLAPGRLGKIAGDVEIALRDEQLAGGR